LPLRLEAWRLEAEVEADADARRGRATATGRLAAGLEWFDDLTTCSGKRRSRSAGHGVAAADG
jgi:hypothetical protein